MMKSWSKFKKLLRDREIGDIITRPQIFYNIPRTKYSTIDSYIRYVKKIGVIENVKLGHYKINSRISKQATISDIKKFAYGKDWKDWFNDKPIFVYDDDE